MINLISPFSSFLEWRYRLTLCFVHDTNGRWLGDGHEHRFPSASDLPVMVANLRVCWCPRVRHRCDCATRDSPGIAGVGIVGTAGSIMPARPLSTAETWAEAGAACISGTTMHAAPTMPAASARRRLPIRTMCSFRVARLPRVCSLPSSISFLHALLSPRTRLSHRWSRKAGRRCWPTCCKAPCRRGRRCSSSPSGAACRRPRTVGPTGAPARN